MLSGQQKTIIKLLFLRKQLYLLLLPLLFLTTLYFYLDQSKTSNTLNSELQQISVKNREGKQVESEILINKYENETYSYRIKNSYGQVQINKSSLSPEDKENFIYTDNPIKEDSQIKTTVLFVDDKDLEFESAEIILNRLDSSEINAILTCPTWKFDTEKGTCEQWEIASEITPKINEDTIAFNVDHFSAYAGAYLEILNFHTHLTAGDIWETKFYTYGTSDLEVKAIESTVYGVDVSFIEFYCGEDKIENAYDGNKVIIPNYSCNGELSRLVNRSITQGSHYLEFTFGETVDRAENFACNTGTLDDTCEVNALQTEANGTIISGTGNLVIKSGGNLSTAVGQSITIDMGGDVIIESGGNITANLTELSAANLDVQTGGNINVNGKGYSGSNGTGQGTDGLSEQGAGGAGYGGNGGAGATGRAGGLSYGSVINPTDFGSGGGNTGSLIGGAGGGALIINVSGTTTVNGSITANGANGAGNTSRQAAGAGSGGSINVTTGILAGTGPITANGGSGASTSVTGPFTQSGAGAGGRIAITYTSKSYSGTIQSSGGSGPTGARDGAAGTIYQKPTTGDGDLTINNSNRAFESTTRLPTGTYTFDNVYIQDAAIFDIQDGVDITVNDSFTPTGNYYISNNSTTGTISYPTPYDLTTTGTSTIEGDGSKWPIQDLTVQSGTLTISNSHTLRNVTIATGATLTHATNGSTYVNDLQLNISGNLDIQGTGKLSADGRGYSGSNGTGQGTDGASEHGAGGAGYGGNGGAGATGRAGGLSYGSVTNPADLGSGGGNSGVLSGGAGGGALIINVSGTTTVNGSITANGANGAGNTSRLATGGGSGGNIRFITETLAGAGSITANGGNGASSTVSGPFARSGGGGGGRILFFSRNSTYTGSFSVAPGIGATGAQNGTAGSTYVDLSQPTQTINDICDIAENGCTISGEVADPQQAYVAASLTGTASEPDSSVESIQVAIKDTTDADWYNNTTNTFGAGSEILFDVTSTDQALPATGTVNWSVDSSSFPWEIDHVYEIKVVTANPYFSSYSTLEFMISNSPPIVENATASQGSDGHVDVTYDVTDIESSSTTISLIYDIGTTLGSNLDTSPNAFAVSDASRFPNSGTIIIGNEFITYTGKSGNTLTGTITRGALNTTAIAHAEGDTVWLLASDTSGDIGSVTNGTGKSITWTAKTDQNGLDYDTMKIRVVANDGASSSMIGSDESLAFAIDIKDPELNAIFRIDASLATPLIYVPCTDENILQMKLGTTADLSDATAQAHANSINFATAGVEFENAMTLYGQCLDPYSNTTAIQTAIIPGVPSNIFYQDVSNPQLDDWREFLAWGVIDGTSIQFESYQIYRSEDGGAYSLHSTITDRQTNYFVDTNLSEAIEYSYKIRSEDVNGNISAYSVVITDTPNGSGGTDLSTPTISGVSVSNVTATQATITWTTNKFSDSNVYFEATSTYPGSNKADYDKSQGNPSMTTSHSVIVSGLTPDTTYSFLVESIDAGDNIATSSNNSYQFTTESGPEISTVSVTQVFDTEAVVTWKTNISANSYVIYSENADLSEPTSTVGSDDLVENHSVTLTNLDLGTSYYFYVRSKDNENNITEDKNIVNGNEQYYTLNTTIDNEDPVISNVEVKLAGEKGATITWITNEDATSTVNWGATSSLGQATEVANVYTTYHSISLTGLSANTQYYYQVQSADRSGNESTGSTANFTTNNVTTVEVKIPPTDESLEEEVANTLSSIIADASERVLQVVLLALAQNDNLDDLDDEELADYLTQITNDRITGPTIGGSNLTIEPAATTAIISWVTDRPSNSLVAYVKDENYDASATNPYVIEAGDSSASVTEHAVTLEGLEPETTYHIQSRSKGSFGPVSVSPDNTFTTTSLTADIDNIQIDRITENSVRLSWATTIPTRSKIIITDPTGRAETYDNSNFIRDHSFETENLNPSTNYTAQVISIDENGNETESPTVSFATVLNSSPPQVSNVRVVTSLIPGKVEQVQTIISWTTNKPATSKVLYDEGVRPNSELRLSTPADNVYRREHMVISSAFMPGKVYSYRVESIDTGGNSGTSQNYTLLTPQPRESVVDLIVKNLEEMFGFLR